MALSRPTDFNFAVPNYQQVVSMFPMDMIDTKS